MNDICNARELVSCVSEVQILRMVDSREEVRCGMEYQVKVAWIRQFSLDLRPHFNGGTMMGWECSKVQTW